MTATETGRSVTPPGSAPVGEVTIDDHQMEEVWEDDPGIVGFLTTVDHKKIGIRYIYTAFAFFFIGGALALTMRLQLAQPGNDVLGPEAYNQLFTMHGTIMIFLFNTPVLAGFGNYLLPLMIGSRDMAYPRLNAFSYWIFLFSGLFIISSFFVGRAPDGGWFAYVPYTDARYSPGINVDFWGLGVIFVGISTTVGGINFIVTAFKLRAPGMAVNRMPIFVWAILSMAFMILFAVPAVTLGEVMLEMDRTWGTAFYVADAGGSTLLYQHLFWFWGHPEVYILFVPATGMISMIIPVFSSRPLAGYLWVAASLVAIAFISFGVWVHHMFATGLPDQAMSFFAAASLIIAIPSGVQFFAWIATMWKGRVRFPTPMLFALGFLLIFLLGGITGVMVAVLPFDWQVHDSYFVVAHFHYVLNGAVVFPIFGAIYFWAPKMFGRMLSERLGKASFWIMFAGFNLAFFPMHILGFLGMPRRIYTYESGLGWDQLNLIVSIGGWVFGFGTLVTLVNFLWSRWRGPRAGANPWDADSLEWAVASPAPHYNFAAIPAVGSRHPLWDQRPLPEVAPGEGEALRAMGRAGVLEEETPITTGLEARPEGTMTVPEDTYLPVLLAGAIALFFIGLLIDQALLWVAAVGGIVVFITWWAWRTEQA